MVCRLSVTERRFWSRAGSKNQTNPLKRRDLAVGFFMHFRGPKALDDKPDITRVQASAVRKWQVGGMRTECFPIQPGEIYGILSALWGFAGLRARVFSYNKRTMDRVNGAFF
jgi:hypothetical protein